MCLAIPMKVATIDGDEAWVESDGTRRKIGLAFCKDARPGDYVIVHAGFAIEILKEDEARRTLQAMREVEDAV